MSPICTIQAAFLTILLATPAAAQERIHFSAAPDPPVITYRAGTVESGMDAVARAMIAEGLEVAERDTAEGSVETTFVAGPTQQRGGSSPTTLLPEYRALAIIRAVEGDSVRVALTYWRRLTDLNRLPLEPTEAFPMHACPSLESGRGTREQILQCRAIRTAFIEQLQRIAARVTTDPLSRPSASP